MPNFRPLRIYNTHTRGTLCTKTNDSRKKYATHFAATNEKKSQLDSSIAQACKSRGSLYLPIFKYTMNMQPYEKRKREREKEKRKRQLSRCVRLAKHLLSLRHLDICHLVTHAIERERERKRKKKK